MHHPPLEGSEQGRWDGHDYVLGWMIDPVEGPLPAERAALWVRFLEEPGERAYRYDLLLRAPTMLRPRQARLLRCGLESLDPRDPAARLQAFLDRPPPFPRPPEVEAAEEAVSEAFDEAAARQDPPDRLPARINTVPAPAMVTLLTEWERLRAQWDPAQKRATAEVLLGAASSLARKWKDLGRFELARAFIQCAGWEGGTIRADLFRQARDQLEAALQPSGSCCGEPMVVWYLVNLMMRMRLPLDDPDILVRTRAQATQRLLDLVAASPRRFVHEQTEIRVDEFPRLFEEIWHARIASEFSTTSLRMLTSMRDDGSASLVHLEHDGILSLQAWERDGGHVILGSMTIDAPVPPAGESLWRFPLDGTEPELLHPRPGVGGVPPLALYEAVHSSADGGLSIGAKIVDPANPAADPSDNPAVRFTLREAPLLELLPGEHPVAPLDPLVFSPDGRRVAVIVPPGLPGGDARLVIFPAGEFWSGRTPVARPPGSAPAGPSDFPPGARLRLAPDSELSRLDWKVFGAREWIAFAEVDYSVTPPRGRAHFIDPNDLAVVATRDLPPVEVIASDTSGFATLVRSPDGLLVGTVGDLVLVPLPPSPDPPRTWSTSTPRGDINCLAWVRTPAWGGQAFFILCLRDMSHNVVRLDMAGDRTETLVGPEGRIPRVDYVSDLEVSPLPERR